MHEKDHSYDRQTLRIFWQASMRYRKEFLLAFLAPAGRLVLTVVVPLYVSKLFAALVIEPDSAMRFMVPIVATSALAIVLNRIGIVSTFVCQARTMADLQTKAFRALLERSVGFHTNTIGGKIVSDAIDYPTAYGQLFVSFFIRILPFFLTIIGGIIVVCLHSLLLGAALVILVAATLGWSWIESRRRSALRRVRHQARKAVAAHLSDTIVNAPTVKTFARERTELQHHHTLNKRLKELSIRDWTRVGIQGNRRMALLLAMQTGFIYLVVLMVRNNPELLAIGIFAFTYTLTLVNRLFELDEITRTTEENLLQASAMTEILLQQAEILDKPGAPALKVSEGGIAFERIAFHYPDTSKHQAVFHDLTFTVSPGEKVGLVGPSGGGKSTLTRLLLRFDDVQQGAISIDGQRIQDVTQTSLHQAIGYVPQEPLLFHRTIRENIAYGAPDADTAAIEAAARKAYALDFIRQLPDGFDTVVGERGIKLSGGQRQRIAIARAILKDAPILLLDEATSALDSESELVIQKALDELMQKRTSIVIAHRLSTIQKLDRIIVLDGGRIVEEGSHRDLVNAGGLYAKLWRHQSGGFIEE